VGVKIALDGKNSNLHVCSIESSQHSASHRQCC
jgi:hypothetical protein